MNNLIENDVLNEYNNLVKNDNLLPIKISEFYMKKVVDEVNHIGVGGPLYKSVIPTRQKISIKTSVETRDYVEEDKHLPIVGVDYIIQKYSDRVLVIITDICFAHCQYCFRTYNLSKFQQSNLKETIKNKVDTLKEYLKNKEEVREVILSGGDPLSIGYDNLCYVLENLKHWNIRIHTRGIVYNPEIFDDKTIELLAKYKVRLVFHINHPYEICEEVECIIGKINDSKVKMYAQFPLLRGINDNAIVLKRLLEKMDELNIRPLSIFIPDPISYSASFRLSYNRIINIMNEINWNTPSWINSVRFVMDTTIGKVRRENIINTRYRDTRVRRVDAGRVQGFRRTYTIHQSDQVDGSGRAESRTGCERSDDQSVLGHNRLYNSPFVSGFYC